MPLSDRTFSDFVRHIGPVLANKCRISANQSTAEATSYDLAAQLARLIMRS